MWAIAPVVPVILYSQSRAAGLPPSRRSVPACSGRDAALVRLEPSMACRGEHRTREPRARQAPDGHQYGGSPSTESCKIKRRRLLAPPLLMQRGEKTAEALQQVLLTLDLGSDSNAQGEPRPQAGATRSLVGVGSSTGCSGRGRGWDLPVLTEPPGVGPPPHRGRSAMHQPRFRQQSTTGSLGHGTA